MRTRSVGSYSVAAIGDSAKARGNGTAEEQNRPQCASFDEMLGILMTLFYGRLMGELLSSLSALSHTERWSRLTGPPS